MRVGEHYRTAKQMVSAPCPSSDPASRGHLPPGEGLGAVLHFTYSETPGCLRGRGPSVFRKSPEETLPKGFLWRFLSFAKRFLSCTSKKENA